MCNLHKYSKYLLYVYHNCNSYMYTICMLFSYCNELQCTVKCVLYVYCLTSGQMATCTPGIGATEFPTAMESLHTEEQRKNQSNIEHF